jgi:hypothetical protein
MKKTIFILFYFVNMLSIYSQSSNDIGILVYFKDGITTKSSVVSGQMIRKAKINKVSLRKSFENIAISEDSLNAALPNFNQSDTLRILEDGRKINQLDMSKLYKIKLRKGLDIYKTIDQLKSLSEVLYAEPDGIIKPEYQPNDPNYQYQWNLEDQFRPDAGIHMEKAWDIYKGNVNNIIAIIDGGVDVTQVDLKNKIVGVNVGIGSGDWANHGTEVAGIAAAETNNNLGIAGVDLNARILPKRMDTGGVAATYQAIVDAVNFSPNVSVLNNSYSIYKGDGITLSPQSLTVREAIAYAYKNNRVFVSVMGNEQLTQPNVTAYPGGNEHVIAVGGTTSDAQIDFHSGIGSHIAVCAPGVNILTTFTGNRYLYGSGTSMAAPHVTGIASLLKGYNSNLANDDIENIIKLSADKIPAMNGDNFNTTYGYGRVNAELALKYLLPPYTFVQQTAISGTTVNTSKQDEAQFFTAGNLASGNYLVQKIEVQKTVPLPNNIINVVGAWGRGAFSTGWSTANPNFGEGFCDVVPGSLTNTSMTLRTYVYDVTTLLGVHLGYYPVSPANATFAYTVLGLIKPTIAGPSQICDQGTYTINNLPSGSTVKWSYSSNIQSVQVQNGSITLKPKNGGWGFVNATVTTNSVPIVLAQFSVWVGPQASFTGSATVKYLETGTWFGGVNCGVEPYIFEWYLRKAGTGASALRVSNDPELMLRSVPVGTSYLLSNTSGPIVNQPITYTTFYLFLRVTDAYGIQNDSPELQFTASGKVDLVPALLLKMNDSIQTSKVAQTESIEVFPNPTSEIVTVKINTVDGFTGNNNAEIKILDKDMNKIKTVQTINKEISINISDCQKGVYFVQVKKNGKQWIQKLIIQ